MDMVLLWEEDAGSARILQAFYINFRLIHEIDPQAGYTVINILDIFFSTKSRQNDIGDFIKLLICQ